MLAEQLVRSFAPKLRDREMLMQSGGKFIQPVGNSHAMLLQWRSTRPDHCCKGRTSSTIPSALSKQSGAYVLAMSVSLVLGHVRSGTNLADKGSRV